MAKRAFALRLQELDPRTGQEIGRPLANRVDFESDNADSRDNIWDHLTGQDPEGTPNLKRLAECYPVQIRREVFNIADSGQGEHSIPEADLPDAGPAEPVVEDIEDEESTD